MATAKPFNYPRFQAFDANGLPLSGGTAEFFEAGTTTNKSIFSDPGLTTAAPNPVDLNSRGEPESGGGSPIDIYLESGPYKIVLKDSSGNTVWTIDDYSDSSIITDPANATDTGTDAYEVALGRDLATGERVEIDFQSANTTTTPTLNNTDGSIGITSLVDRDGTALWVGAIDGVHTVQYDGTDYIVLDPIPDIPLSTDLLDEDDMASDSDTAVPTQQSVVAWGLAAPSSSSDPSLAFDTWRKPNADRATLVTVRLFVETDGSSAGDAFVELDESGGTTQDYIPLEAYVDASTGSGIDARGSGTVFVPAGATYRITNSSDPNGVNNIIDHREFTL